MFILYDKKGLIFKGNISSPKGEAAKTAHEIERIRRNYDHILVGDSAIQVKIQFNDIRHYRKMLI